MKIAFCGDSFCADIGKETWPHKIKTKFNASIIWRGKQGASQYTILSHAKKVLYQNPDLIIFCHTDPYRLPNRHYEPLGARPCESVYNRILKENLNYPFKNIFLFLKKNNKDNIWTTGHLYYEHLMDWGFHELSHIALVKECDKICKESNTKVLHLFSFSTEELKHKEYNWDVKLDNSYCDKSLSRISYDYQTPDNHKQDWIEPGWRTLPNHMNYEGNRFVSELVLGML